MNIESTPETSFPVAGSSVTAAPCAVIYAGSEMMLALPAREGRFPINVTSIQEPLIAWVSSDGKQEFIELTGERASSDHTAIVEQLLAEDLLVAEVGDVGDPDLSAAKHWLAYYTAFETSGERAR
jgi:hypothetical protein